MSDLVDRGMPPKTPVLSTARRSSSHLVLLLMAGAVVGKGLGFAREILMAHVLGASVVADAYRAATTGIMMPLAAFQNESVPTTLIPLHLRWQEANIAPRMFAALSIAVTAVGVVLLGLVIRFGAEWVDVLVGGFSPAGKARTLEFMQILALAMPASVLVNVLAACEISLGRSRLTAIRASLVNVSVIVGILCLMFLGWSNAIAWAFSIAFNALGIWGITRLVAEGALDFGAVRLSDIGAATRAFLHQFLPLMLVPLAEQGNIWVERLIASGLLVGTVASLDYARTITDSAVLFISQPIGLVLLARFSGKDDHEKILVMMRPLLAASLPICVALAIFAPDVARAVFERGAFNDEAVRTTADAIRGISAGLWASTVGWVVLRLLNGAGRNMAAAAIIVLAFLANIAFNVAVFEIAPNLLPGSLVLGLGEAVRGLVLLFTTLVVLEIMRPSLNMILLALVPTAVMMSCGLAIHGLVPHVWARLTLACPATLISMIIGLQILSPNLVNLGLRHCFRLVNRVLGRP